MSIGIESRPAWQIGETPAGVAPSSPHGAQQGLRQLALLRALAPLAQAPTLLLANQHYGVQVPTAPVAGLLVLELLIAAGTWQGVRRGAHIGTFGLFLNVQLDIVLFAAMLYLTGGTSNPFSPLFLLPLVIAASALPARWVWATAAITVGAYRFLLDHHVPLGHAGGETAMREVYRDGSLANYVLVAALVAFFVLRAHAALRRREQMLAAARETQMRNECAASVGALAARCAHELGSPLATMAVVVNELLRERPTDAPLQHDLRVVDDQIKASKQIVSDLASAGGQRRAESAGGAKLDAFLRGIVERARALHPGATILADFDARTPPPCVLTEETLRQAITNLIDHAVQASPQHVHVSADWSGAELQVAVRHRGPGFASRTLMQLGKPIEPIGVEGNVRDVGLLLGAITVERMGGHLALVNEPGVGGIARLRLPLGAITIESGKGRAVDGYAH